MKIGGDDMRLIDVDPLRAQIVEHIQQGGASARVLTTFLRLLDVTPTATVLCKECKYYGTPKNYKKPYCVRGAYVKVNENDYCSKGVKR